MEIDQRHRHAKTLGVLAIIVIVGAMGLIIGLSENSASRPITYYPLVLPFVPLLMSFNFAKKFSNAGAGSLVLIIPFVGLIIGGVFLAMKRRGNKTNGPT